MAYRRIRSGKRVKNQRFRRWTVLKRCARRLFYEPLEDRRLLAVYVSTIDGGWQDWETLEDSTANTSDSTDHVEIAADTNGTGSGGVEAVTEVVVDTVDVPPALNSSVSDSTTDSTTTYQTSGGTDGGTDGGLDGGTDGGGDTPSDPLGVSVPRDLMGAPGSSVIVPVHAVGDLSDVSTADFVLAYDTSLLDTANDKITAGDLWPGATVLAQVDEVNGQITVALYGADPLPTAGPGSLFNIEFEVSELAPDGAATPIDLQVVGANDGLKPIVPSPESGSDPTDGLITIGTPPLLGRIDLSITATSPTPDPRTGELARLPDNLEWVDAWGSFVVGIWATSVGNTSAAMGGVSAFLKYNTAVFSALDIKFGPAFVGHAKQIDEGAGEVNLVGMTTVLDIGVGRPTLVAEVRFAATDSDPGVDIMSDREAALAAHDLNLSVRDGYVDFIGRRASDPVVGRMPETKFIPVAYDIDQDKQISMNDFAHFVAKFLDPGRDVGGDFDASGTVDFTDFAWFTANFGKKRSDSINPSYPDSLIDYWMGDRPAPQSFVRNDNSPTAGQAALNDQIDPFAESPPAVAELGASEEPTVAGHSATVGLDGTVVEPQQTAVPQQAEIGTIGIAPDGLDGANPPATIATVPLAPASPLDDLSDVSSEGNADGMDVATLAALLADGLMSEDLALDSSGGADELDLLLDQERLDPSLIDGAFVAAK